MPTLLDENALRAALESLPGWAGDRTALHRTVHAPSFLDGIALVGEVARVAEQMDHHPDIDIRWRDVTFTLATHSAGGVTDLDVTLARRIDELAGG